MRPLLQWRSNKYYILRVCVCSIRYKHAPYCHLWPARLHYIFPHYLIKGMIFYLKKRLLNMKCVLLFSIQFPYQKSLILRMAERDMIKYVSRSSCKGTCYYQHPLMELEFSRQIFFKITQVSNSIKIRPVGVDGRTDRQTDRHGQANSLFSIYCERS